MRRCKWLWVLLSLGLIFTLHVADVVAVITLLSFQAAVQGPDVALDWETETEIDVVGFYIDRSENGGAFVRLQEIGLVPAQGSAMGGAVYSELDETAVYGRMYTYKLVVVETNTNEVDLAIANVTMPGALFLPIVVGNSRP